MTLYEMSFVYSDDAMRFRVRILELREAAKEAEPEEAKLLKRRIEELQTLLRQSRELAEMTRRYYERSYHKNEKYTI